MIIVSGDIDGPILIELSELNATTTGKPVTSCNVAAVA
jgi:hypothetical protein